MDHSIFGSLIDINADGKEESYCSKEGFYGEEQSNSCIPESSVNYYSDFTTEDGINEEDKNEASSSKKFIKARPKKKTAGKNKELRFKCPQCDYKTWKKSNYQRHLGTHNKKQYRCTLCPFSGKHADDLQQHIICHKKKEPSEKINVNHFALVQKLINNEQSYRLISNNHTASGISKEIKNEPQNVKIKAETGSYCPPVVVPEVYLDEQSSNSCVGESSLEDEYDSDVLPLAVNIDVANQSKRDSLSIIPVKNTTIPVHSIDIPSAARNDKELRFSCPYCNYRTWKTSNFQRHLCTHTNERPYKCHLCKYSGKHQEDLKKHMICHNKTPGTFHIANNETTIIPINPPRINENELIKKALMNNNTKRFTCLLCDFETTRSSALNRHQFVVHNDNRPYACDLCPYRSKLRDSLKKHMMSHTDERPFECEICHHRCRQRGDLKRHLLLHTGERPFACPHCPYRSNRTQLLKKHISRRHSIPHISTEITVTKTVTTEYEEFGSHYLAEMF